MIRRYSLFVVPAAVGVSACVSQAQPMAMQNAEVRRRFELNCPSATATVLSREVIQPVLQGPFIGPGISRAEYTIGIAGCGARKTFVVTCPEAGDGCFAAGPGRFIRE
jgi:hypothetical protein